MAIKSQKKLLKAVLYNVKKAQRNGLCREGIKNMGGYPGKRYFNADLCTVIAEPQCINRIFPLTNIFTKQNNNAKIWF